MKRLLVGLVAALALPISGCEFLTAPKPECRIYSVWTTQEGKTVTINVGTIPASGDICNTPRAVRPGDTR